MVEILVTYGVPLLAAVIAYLFYKWLKFIVEKEHIERLLYAIISIITKVEQTSGIKTGIAKKAEAVRQVEKLIPAKNKNLLQKAFGGIENAVEKAFQISHLAGKVKKIF